jgi:hypothetical protein
MLYLVKEAVHDSRLQKIKTILAFDNESQRIRAVLLPWLASVLKTSIAHQG